jgi:hypothetical protein
MSESICHEAIYKFCENVIVVFGKYYLSMGDTARLLSIKKSRGFPRIFDSIDCMHLQWKNYLFSWQRQFKGHKEGYTVGGCCLTGSLDLTLLIWYGRIKQ